MSAADAPHPHGAGQVFAAGAPLDEAEAAVLLLHGRGAPAQDILGLGQALNLEGVAYLAPQAANYQWYPQRFMEPTERNQPWLDSALRRVREVLERIAEAGIPPERTVLAGFSQGACLASESVARHGTRYGGLAALSGGLIGATVDEDRYPEGLAGTPAFLGCSDVDPHIPKSRVDETAELLEARGAVVDKRIYPGMAHTVNEDEVAALRAIVADLLPD